MAFIVLFSWVALPTISKKMGGRYCPPCTFSLKIYTCDGFQSIDADGKDILSFILYHLFVFNVMSKKIK